MANRRKRIRLMTDAIETSNQGAIETHHVVEPPILYLGTPVVLVSTENEDGSPNLSPMSSAWWIGWSCMLGLMASSKTSQNLERTGECVLNLPSDNLAGHVDRLALTTGSSVVPRDKREMGVRYVPDKFGHANLTASASDVVRPPRVRECPIQLEAKLSDVRPFGRNDERVGTGILAFELSVIRVHAHPSVVVSQKRNRIDPSRWRPLIMSFRKFYGLGAEVHPSRLSEFPEHYYSPLKFRDPTEKAK